MKMCRMREEVECREVRVAWLLDNTDREVMAVKTEEGWREIMLGPTVGGDEDIWEEETSRHHTSHGLLEENLIPPLHQTQVRPSHSPTVNTGPGRFPSMVTSHLLNVFVRNTFCFVLKLMMTANL